MTNPHSNVDSVARYQPPAIGKTIRRERERERERERKREREYCISYLKFCPF